MVRDTPEKEKDSRRCKSHFRNPSGSRTSAQAAIDIDLFRKYLAFSKQIEPRLTTEAIDIIRAYYMKMRNVDSDAMITVTPRQLEGLVRLSTARSRLLLKEK